MPRAKPPIEIFFPQLAFYADVFGEVLRWASTDLRTYHALQRVDKRTQSMVKRLVGPEDVARAVFRAFKKKTKVTDFPDDLAAARAMKKCGLALSPPVLWAFVLQHPILLEGADYAYRSLKDRLVQTRFWDPKELVEAYYSRVLEPELPSIYPPLLIKLSRDSFAKQGKKGAKVVACAADSIYYMLLPSLRDPNVLLRDSLRPARGRILSLDELRKMPES